jgi:hypothetical protein
MVRWIINYIKTCKCDHEMELIAENCFVWFIDVRSVDTRRDIKSKIDTIIDAERV